MRKPLAFFALALICFVLALAAPSPAARVAEAAEAAPDRCEDCMVNVFARYEQCLAQFGSDPRGQRCHDQYNEGVVQCFRNFCEQ